MLRRSCLRLVALSFLCSLLGACGLVEAPQNSDEEPVGYTAILDGRSLLSSGDSAAAALHFERLVAEHPTSLQANRALQDAMRAQLSEADFLARYERQVEQNPQSSLAYYLRGRSRIEQAPRAEADFRRAAELDKGNSWAVAGLAYLAYQRGDLFAAVQTYEQAIAASPRSAHLRLLLGNQYLELKLFVDAQRQLEAAHRLAPEDVEVWAALGKVLLALGQEQEALELLERVRSTEPRLAHITPSLAAIYLRRGDPSAAEKVYQEGLKAGLSADEELAAEIYAAGVLERLDKD